MPTLTNLDKSKKYQAGNTHLVYVTAEQNPLIEQEGWLVELQVNYLYDRAAVMLHHLDEWLQKAILEEVVEQVNN